MKGIAVQSARYQIRLIYTLALQQRAEIWQWDASYGRIVLWVETIRKPRAGRRAELMRRVSL